MATHVSPTPNLDATLGSRRPRSLARPLVLAAVIGALVTTGALAAAGVFSRTKATTVVQTTTAASTAGTSGASHLDAAALFAAASPGVVDITSTGTASSSGQSFPFGGGGSQTQTATGTGFQVDSKGDIVTAQHVVAGASKVTVTFQDGSVRSATVLGSDKGTDVAVLKVDASGLTLHPLKLGSSASLKVGDSVAAIGDPFGYTRSISTGIVSGLDRTIQAPNGFQVAHAIQTDAAVNPGNSGGPLLDSSGRVLGIIDQIVTGNGGADQSSGVGFAVPSTLVASELSQLEAGKQVTHGYLGIATSSSDTTDGALVGSVGAGGPAAQAGLKRGDVITSFGGKQISGSDALIAAISAAKPGDRVAVTVRRGSQALKLTITLGTQPRTASAG